jgi:hypothetical protein
MAYKILERNVNETKRGDRVAVQDGSFLWHGEFIGFAENPNYCYIEYDRDQFWETFWHKIVKPGRKVSVKFVLVAEQQETI